jgi:hypothetical protein
MSHSSTVALLFLALPLVAVPTAGAQEKPPSSRRVEVAKPYLAKKGNTYLLVHSITSTESKELSWGLVEVNGPDGSRKCEWLKRLEPKQAYRFECPLQDAAGQKFASRVRVYSNAKLTDRELLYESVLDVTPQGLAAADASGVSAGTTVVPDGVVEGMDVTLPATFKSTWYRRVDRGFSMRAYENSGDLTVSTGELAFTDGKKTVRLPHAQILSVRWEPLPNDIANHWVVVRFTNDEGKPDGVAFRDGGRMGLRGETGMIYQAVRRAVKK